MAMRRRAGFSLIELVVVVVIIGLIAAIAVPRFGSAVESTSDGNVTANLRVLRQAIETYHVEHEGQYPTLADFEAQLTTYTDVQGNVSATPSTSTPFGPYLRQIPTFKTVRAKGNVGAAAGAGIDWIYDQTTGQIYANGGTLKDQHNRLYTDY